MQFQRLLPGLVLPRWGKRDFYVSEVTKLVPLWGIDDLMETYVLYVIAGSNTPGAERGIHDLMETYALSLLIAIGITLITTLTTPTSHTLLTLRFPRDWCRTILDSCALLAEVLDFLNPDTIYNRISVCTLSFAFALALALACTLTLAFAGA